MDRRADLDAALNFVIGRIVKQATLSGEPLTDEQTLLLNYLPSAALQAVGGDPEGVLVPRNINYERLCALGKTAYLNDRDANPTSLDWEFAFAVFALNRHLMWGLLHGAGLRRRRSLSDQLLLIFTALLLLFALIFLASRGPGDSRHLAEVGSGCLVVMALLYFAALRIEKRRLEKDIERFRLASRFANAIG